MMAAWRAASFRIADAIDEAAQVAQVVVDEGFHLQLQGQFIAQLAVHRQAGVEQVAAVVRLHPDEQVALGGGHLALQVEGGKSKSEDRRDQSPGPKATSTGVRSPARAKAWRKARRMRFLSWPPPRAYSRNKCWV